MLLDYASFPAPTLSFPMDDQLSLSELNPRSEVYNPRKSNMHIQNDGLDIVTLKYETHIDI